MTIEIKLTNEGVAINIFESKDVWSKGYYRFNSAEESKQFAVEIKQSINKLQERLQNRILKEQ